MALVQLHSITSAWNELRHTAQGKILPNLRNQTVELEIIILVLGWIMTNLETKYGTIFSIPDQGLPMQQKAFILS